MYFQSIKIILCRLLENSHPGNSRDGGAGGPVARGTEGTGDRGTEETCPPLRPARHPVAPEKAEQLKKEALPSNNTISCKCMQNSESTAASVRQTNSNVTVRNDVPHSGQDGRTGLPPVTGAGGA